MHRVTCDQFRCEFAPLYWNESDAFTAAVIHDAQHRCPICRGKGESTDQRFACEHCHGSGRIEVPREQWAQGVHDAEACTR